MSARLRMTLLAGSALILALELPDLGRLLHSDLFGPRPALASARAEQGGLRRVAAVAALAAVDLLDGTMTTGVRLDGDQEPR